MPFKKRTMIKSRGDKWGFFKKLTYGTMVSLLLLAFLMACAMWLDYYQVTYPDLVQAVAMRYVEELPLDGVLLWDEKIVTAPREGAVTYPSFLPRRVAKGDALAAVDDLAVRTGAPGYFLPALDGQEGGWSYLRLWSGTFPPLKAAVAVKNGTYLRKGDALGKLVELPQELKCIAYLDRTPLLEQNIRNNFINIKTEPQGKSRRAEVRAAEIMEQKIKVYLTLPFFQPSLLSTRAFSCSVQTGDLRGFAVPDTAVILRGGKQGVFAVRGNVTAFVEVEGFPADKYSFFVTKGLESNERVVLYADKAKEKVVVRQ